MQEIIAFLEEYTEFFEQMETKQAEKLGLIMTKELGKIESALLLEESMEKQIQNMEKRRLECFAANGLEGKKLHQLVEESQGEEREKLRQLKLRLEGAIGNIRYYNGKSNQLAREELIRLGGDTRFQDNPAGIYSPSSFPGKGQKLERKV